MTLFKVAQANPGSIPTILNSIKELADEALKGTLEVAQRQAFEQLKKNIAAIESKYEKGLGKILSSIEGMVQKEVAKIKPPKGDQGDKPSRDELLELIELVMPKVENGKDAPIPTSEEIAVALKPVFLEFMTQDSILSRMLDERDKAHNDAVYGKVIDLIAAEIGKMRKFSGGGASGDRVRAGDGITITRDVLGRAVLSVSGSGAVETPTGTVNGSNTAFVVTRTPKWIVADGIQYFEGAGYSLSGLNVTMDLAPSQFIRAVA